MLGYICILSLRDPVTYTEIGGCYDESRGLSKRRNALRVLLPGISPLAVVDAWDRQFDRRRVQFCKRSFVPDHVHLAIRTHPSVVPADLVVELLNSSQQLMFQAFDRLVIATGNRRLWKPIAYVGMYGDLSNQQVQVYLRNWRNGRTNQLAGPRRPT